MQTIGDLALRCENVSKLYRLGEVGTGTLSHDLNRAWARLLKREDPTSKLGAINNRASQEGGDYVWALRNIDFEVVRGETVGIIGRNGAGKSTLLKLLSRITAPTEGRISINYRIASLLEVGTGFHPELTGRENIFLNGSFLGMTKSEILRNFEEIVEFSGCAKYIDTPVKRYSSGMHVRLAFAVAAHLETEILIVDEVLAVGDADFQARCLGKMRDLNSASSRTVLFVSHNMASVEALCQRSVVMDMGQISFRGTTSEAVDQYLTGNLDAVSSDLRNEKNRSGEGRLKFTGVNVCRIGSGRDVNRVQTGDDIEIEVQIENPQKLSGIGISVAIFDHREQIVTDLVTQTQSFWPDIPEEGCKIVCRIANIPLNKGMYFISLYCTASGVKQDHIEKAAILEVESGDFYGTGILPMPGSGSTLLRHSWEVR